MLILLRGALATLALAASFAEAEASPCEAQGNGAPMISPDEPLTLRAALGEIRRASPAIRSAGLEARALEAEADQAARRLNPSLSLEVENFSGSGPLSGFDQAETTLAVEQTFRLGGKRRLDERAARARQALASAQCAVILRETELEAALLFVELVAAVQLRDLAQDSADLADELTATVQRRLNAGEAAPPEFARVRADAAALRAEVESTEANVDRLRFALAVLWGSAEPTFALPSGIFVETAPSSAPASHPAQDSADAAIRMYAAEQDLARRGVIPDVTVSAGYRRFEDTGDGAVVAGISLPLPLFDRGRDTTRAAMLRSEAALVNQAAIQQQLLAQQRAAVSARRAAQARLDILNSDALPFAQEAYEAALRGYQVGRFDLTATLNARTALLETRLALINAELALKNEDLRLRALIGAAPFNGETQ